MRPVRRPGNFEQPASRVPVGAAGGARPGWVQNIDAEGTGPAGGHRFTVQGHTVTLPIGEV